MPTFQSGYNIHDDVIHCRPACCQDFQKGGLVVGPSGHAVAARDGGGGGGGGDSHHSRMEAHGL